MEGPEGVFHPAQRIAPLGTGSSLSALTATINTANTAFLTSTSAFVGAPNNPRPDQPGSGAWGRVTAGTLETTSNSVGTVLQHSKDFEAKGPSIDIGRQTCDTTTRQDYWGFQVGYGISILNRGGTGANWHWGVTAGYLEARTKDTTQAGTFTNFNHPDHPGGLTFDTPAGAFKSDTQVPFVGIYTLFTNGGFFLDGQARWDFFRNILADSNNGLSGERLNARGFSLTSNVGQNIPLASGWFFEPSGGIVWSRVKVDTFNAPGVTILVPDFAVTLGRGSVKIDDIDSVLGRATLRVGKNFASGGVLWQPFFAASVFHEFVGDVTARARADQNTFVFLPDGTTIPNDGFNGFTLGIKSEGGLGTYGQFGLGMAMVIGDTGWRSYARGDYRIGENLEGWSVNAGLRYEF